MVNVSKKQLIFVSYRRSDSSGWVGHIVDDLTSRSGGSQFFYDIDSIRAGADFADEISQTIRRSNRILVIIGPNWLNAKDADGKQRLQHSEDHVRLEVEAALTRDISVIPVLVGGAQMPPRDHLPESLRKLAYRQAIEIRDTRWKDDITHLASEMGLLNGRGNKCGRFFALLRAIRILPSALFGLFLICFVTIFGYLWWYNYPLSLDSSIKTSVGNNFQPVDLDFVNSSGVLANVYWIDYAGVEMRYCSLPPNAACSQRTYLGHRWIAKSSDGKTIMEYTAGKDGSPFTVYIK